MMGGLELTFLGKLRIKHRCFEKPNEENLEIGSFS